MKIPIMYLSPGMYVSKDIYGSRGFLLKKNTQISQKHIELLKNHGVKLVNVYEDSNGALIDSIYNELRFKTMYLVERWFEDPNKKHILGSAICQVGKLVNEIMKGNANIECLTELTSIGEYTYAHSVDVCVLSLSLGIKLGYDKKTLLNIGIGALLHDIGKSKIPDDILNKSNALTNKEYSIIKTHPVLGYKIILEDFKDHVNNDILSIILNHHERIDGSGYMRGINENDIDEFTQIVAISDIYNALISDRVYRKAIPFSDAIDVVKGLGGIKVNKNIVSAFLNGIDNMQIGSAVLLTSGDVGIIYDILEYNKFRPIVKIFGSSKTINLSKDKSIGIAKLLTSQDVRSILESKRYATKSMAI